MSNSNTDDEMSDSQYIVGLTDQLLSFVPSATGELSEEQEAALKRATFYFCQQFLIQQKSSVFQNQINLDDKSSDMCRICREAGSKENLITPCACKGTMRFIHLSCLEHWLAESDTTNCELCSHQYETIRTPKYGIVKSILLWLRNPGRRREAREIMMDAIALIIFTPMAFFGTYMSLLAAESCSPQRCQTFIMLWSDHVLLFACTVFIRCGRSYRRYLQHILLLMLIINVIITHHFCMLSKWYYSEDNLLISPTLTRIISLGCVGVVGAIDTAYFSWLLLRAQHHARSWHKWWRRHSVVRVILPPNDNQQMKPDEEDTAGVRPNSV